MGNNPTQQIQNRIAYCLPACATKIKLHLAFFQLLVEYYNFGNRRWYVQKSPAMHARMWEGGRTRLIQEGRTDLFLALSLPVSLFVQPIFCVCGAQSRELSLAACAGWLRFCVSVLNAMHSMVIYYSCLTGWPIACSLHPVLCCSRSMIIIVSTGCWCCQWILTTFSIHRKLFLAQKLWNTEQEVTTLFIHGYTQGK